MSNDISEKRSYGRIFLCGFVSGKRSEEKAAQLRDALFPENSSLLTKHGCNMIYSSNWHSAEANSLAN